LNRLDLASLSGLNRDMRGVHSRRPTEFGAPRDPAYASTAVAWGAGDDACVVKEDPAPFDPSVLRGGVQQLSCQGPR